MNRPKRLNSLPKLIAPQATASGRSMHLKTVNQRQEVAPCAATVAVDAFGDIAQVDGQRAVGTVRAGFIEDARQAKFAAGAVRRILPEVGQNLFCRRLLNERINVR
ncbi:MAG: hypothetical protein R3C59_20840 [Planctomycetaceae bacterium]